MLAFSVIKIAQHRALHRNPATESAPLRDTVATSLSLAAKPGSSESITGEPGCRLAKSSLIQTSVSSFQAVELNRQTQEIEHPVTYRKQTTADSSNRQKIQKWACAFSVPSCARVTKRSALVVSLTPPRVA